MTGVRGWVLRVLIKMSSENIKRHKVSFSAKVLPCRCAAVKQASASKQLCPDNRPKSVLCHLKWVPIGVQTLNDHQFITTPSC